MGKSLYTQELADAICDRLEAGDSLRKACETAGGPDPSTVLRWTQDAVCIGFAQQYTRAREAGYQKLGDELIEIADTPQIGIETKLRPDGSRETTEGDMLGHRKLQIDTRKWMLSKMLPKLYGDKIVTTHQVGETITKIIREIVDPLAP